MPIIKDKSKPKFDKEKEKKTVLKIVQEEHKDKSYHELSRQSETINIGREIVDIKSKEEFTRGKIDNRNSEMSSDQFKEMIKSREEN